MHSAVENPAVITDLFSRKNMKKQLAKGLRSKPMGHIGKLEGHATRQIPRPLTTLPCTCNLRRAARKKDPPKKSARPF